MFVILDEVKCFASISCIECEVMEIILKMTGSSTGIAQSFLYILSRI